MKIFWPCLYFSEDLLLPAPNYFLIGFKEISSPILAKWGTISLPIPCGHATASDAWIMKSLLFVTVVVLCFKFCFLLVETTSLFVTYKGV